MLSSGLFKQVILHIYIYIFMYIFQQYPKSKSEALFLVLLSLESSVPTKPTASHFQPGLSCNSSVVQGCNLLKVLVLFEYNQGSVACKVIN